MSGAIEALAAGRHQQPHDLLGQHLEPGGLRLRVFRPMARTVAVRFDDGERLDLHHEAHGVWTGVREGQSRTMDYRVHVAYDDGVEHEQDDPYRFAPTLGQVDLHLIGEGRHEQLWTVLGAHVREYAGPLGTVRGTSFAVWAPRARAVHVIGDFNGWDSIRHPMRLLGESGVWELFIPGVGEGTRYKYAIRGPDEPGPLQGRPDGPGHRGSRRAAGHRHPARSTSGATTTGWSDAAPPTRTPGP